MHPHHQPAVLESVKERTESRHAMALSLATGAAMLLAKVGAWWITGSSAILSDAIESVIHVAAVAFAAFSLWLSVRPASEKHPYGYERIAFFSAGAEGALIIVAAAAIIAAAVEKWIHGIQLEALGLGTAIVAAAGALNAGLGFYLVRLGRRSNSIILEANGKHVLTDSWTSLGVLVGLGMVMATGWRPFDPICAIAVALNILWSGGGLVYRSALGLLDYADPEVASALTAKLNGLAAEHGVQWHNLRFRGTGKRTIAEVHLLFPASLPIGEAHEKATWIERRLESEFGSPLEVITHLESEEDHEIRHGR
ncbi:MAG: cation transporter [Bryobacteraceae bacterium]|nr:cation transporter [Bryobacteraceae bacterium]